MMNAFSLFHTLSRSTDRRENVQKKRVIPPLLRCQWVHWRRRRCSASGKTSARPFRCVVYFLICLNLLTNIFYSKKSENIIAGAW